MPLEAIAINDLSTPLIKKPQCEDELKKRLQALYGQNSDFVSGKHVIDDLQQVFASGGCLYVGMFNDKPICAVSCVVDDTKKVSKLGHLTVHPQNKNRGIELDFLRKVDRLQTNLVSDNATIHAFLQQLMP